MTHEYVNALELITTLSGQCELTESGKTFYNVCPIGNAFEELPVPLTACHMLPSGSTPDTIVFKEVGTMNFYGFSLEDYESTWILIDN